MDRDADRTLEDVTQTSPAAAPVQAPPGRHRRVHRAWFVAAVTFVTITGAAAFRSRPGLLVDPLHEEFGW
ncbi:hypothetical protein LK08_07900 [Streptomyces sp. MUSC 125]|nr:hypothetical protein LK08_07900 [Streptomyces sp. MUSC 125]